MRTPIKAAVVLGATGALLAGGVVSANALSAPKTLSPGIRVVGLTTSGQLTSIDTGRDKASTPKSLIGLASGDKVVGIDYRPAKNKLFGVARATNGNVKVFKISPASGRIYNPKFLTVNGTRVVTSATKFGVDFNPTVDRLRIVSTAGDNWRVNTADGATIVDGNLKFAAGDANAGKSPRVPSVAYTNSAKNQTTTTLYDVESGTDSLLRQAPPNDGTLTTVAKLTKDVRQFTGFDIFTKGASNTALISNTSSGQTKIYSISLTTGAVAGKSEISGRALLDIAAPTGR